MSGALPTASDSWRIALSERVVVSGPGGGDATPRARKARALVALLACKPDRSASRAEVVGLLWSDRGRIQALASLRQCLFQLRTEAPGLVAAGGERILLTNCAVEGAPAGDGRHDRAAWLSDLDQVDRAFDRWLADRRPPGAAPVGPLVGAGEMPAVAARRGRSRWVIAAAVLAVVGLGSWLLIRPYTAARAPRARVVDLRPWSVIPADPAMRAQAERFVAVVRAGLPTARLSVRVIDAGQQPAVPARDLDADWVMSGQILARGELTTLISRIQTPRGVLLWSWRVESGTNGLAQAGDRLAERTATVLICAAGGPRGMRRGDDVTALLMDVCAKRVSANADNDLEAMVVAARRFVAAAPGDAYAHGFLAAALAMEAADMPESLRAAVRVEAASQAKQALALDPGTGEAYIALGQLALDRREFDKAEALFLHGLAVEPDHPSLPAFAADLFKSVGRTAEALVFDRRALALDPTATGKTADVAETLARMGQMRAALALLDQAEAQRGSNAVLTVTRISILLRGGDPAAARAALERGASVPGYIEAPAQAALLRQTRAIENPHGPEAQAVLREFSGLSDGRPGFASRQVLALSSLGRTEAALDVAVRDLIDPEILFRPAQRAMLRSPRFPEVARRQGLWRYWEVTGRWPDICREPALPWRCVASVKKALNPR